MLKTTDEYVHQVRTGELAHVHARLLVAYVKRMSVLSINWNAAVQLYDGISAPLAIFVTLTCSVSPTNVPPELVSSVDELLSNVPASDCQLIDAETLAPGINLASGDLQ